MTSLLDQDPPAATGHRDRWSTVVISLMAIAGLMVVLYPTTAAWFAAKAQEAAVDAWSEKMEQVTPQEKLEAITAAERYNAAIPQILLTDPYTLDDARSGRGGAYETYSQQLTVDDDEVMGRVRIPTIEVDLPIYHGTDDGSLDRGVGHLFGSSLPVGGPGTHSVLTAHSGLVSATMFDDLEQVGVGDVVQVDVMDRTLLYRVTSTQVVLPTEVADLKLVAGRDLITLVTCTPTGVNTHRLLVHAERVEPDSLDTPARTQLTQAGSVAGFPWWSVHLGVGVVVLPLLVILLRRPRTSGGRHAARSAGPPTHVA